MAEVRSPRADTDRRLLIHYWTLTTLYTHPQVYTSAADSGVVLTIRYLCSPRQRRGTAEALWERILEAVAESPDIGFAYPTQSCWWLVRSEQRLGGSHPATRSTA